MLYIILHVLNYMTVQYCTSGVIIALFRAGRFFTVCRPGHVLMRDSPAQPKSIANQ